MTIAPAVAGVLSVRLYVDRGEGGKLRCYETRFAEPYSSTGRHARGQKFEGYWIGPIAAESLRWARAWWLVECTGIGAGRDLIAEHRACGAIGADVKHGRILAASPSAVASS